MNPTLKKQLRRAKRKNSERKPPVTVYVAGYADASFCHVNGQGGVACWLRSDTKRALHAAKIPPWVVNSVQAETVAVCEAFRLSLELSKKATVAVVKTDCSAVVGMFDPQIEPKIPEPLEKMILEVLHQASNRNVRLIVKWVKGHSDADTVQSYLNNRVDELAKNASILGKEFYWETVLAV